MTTVFVPGQGDVEFPESMSDAQIAGVIKKQYPLLKGDVSNMPSMDPTEGMTGSEKFLAGAGKAMVDIGRGAGQLVGAVSGKDVAESRRLDQPLMKTGAGQAGYLTGGLATAAPAALIPGAGTVAGSAALGAGLGALQPTVEGESRLKNVALGGAVGGGGALALKGAGAVISPMVQKAKTQAEDLAKRFSVRSGTIKAAQQEGYVLPPSVTGGGYVSKTLESVGGKAAVAQEASIRNQQVTNRIARREAGLAEDEPITEGSLAKAREAFAQPYREVAAISPRANRALEMLQEARLDSKDAWKKYGGPSGGPEERRAALAADNRVKVLERLIDREAKAAGRADLLPALRQARVNIAKNHDVEAALNVGDGNIDANVIGRILDRRGEKAVTGGLQTIGKFAQAFRPFASERAGGQSAPGVGYLRPWTPLLLGSLGMGATEYTGGHPYGIVAGALPLLSGPARSVVLSRAMQQAPEYAPSLLSRAAEPALLGAQRGLPIPLSEAMLQNREQQ